MYSKNHRGNCGFLSGYNLLAENVAAKAALITDGAVALLPLDTATWAGSG